MDAVLHNRSRLVGLMALLVGFTLARQAWTFYTLAGGRNDAGEVVFRVVPMVLATLLVGLVAQVQVGRLRPALGWITASLACFTLGVIINSVLQFLLGANTFPSLADLFSTLSMPLLVIGFMKLPHAKHRLHERVRQGLDASIIVTVIAGYGWFFVLARAILGHLAREGIGISMILATTYPIYDLVVLAGMLIVSAQWNRSHVGAEVGLMMAAVVCWLLADGYFLARCFIAGMPVTHPLEAGWAWGTTLFALVAFRSLRWPDPERAAPALAMTGVAAANMARGQDAPSSLSPGPLSPGWSIPADLPTRYGAYLALPAALLLVWFGRTAHPLQWIGTQIVAGLVVLLVIIRQIVLSLDLERVNAELHRLSAALESRVGERTEELELTRAQEQRRTRVLEMIVRDEPLGRIQAEAAQLGPAVAQNLERFASERRTLLDRLEFQATCDALTGLPNRTQCLQALTGALHLASRSKTAVAALFIDLDRFKDINDTLGHPVGDAVLCEVVRRFQSCLPAGALLSRLGGDEFLVMLPGLEPVGAPAVAEKVGKALLSAVGPAIRVSEAEVFVGASIGASLAPRDTADAVSLQKYADAAMYRAKRGGLGYGVFTPDLNTSAAQRLNIERLLRRALEEGPAKFFHLVYQPIFDLGSNDLGSNGQGSNQLGSNQLGSNRVVAVEALLRWSDPNLRLSPAEFIPVAEHSGLIVALGSWVLGTACAQIAEWHRAGLEVRVNVNVSTLQFERPDFVAVVRQALQGSGLPASSLCLELLESVLVSRFDEIAARITQLRSTGVQFALDDFGSGYSSLSYLGRLSFDALKIDRSFTSGLGAGLGTGTGAGNGPGNEVGSERDTRPLVASVLSIAQAFGMEAVAEGVETQSQLDTLRALGCTKIQGFLFSRPLLGRDLELLLRRGLSEPESA